MSKSISKLKSALEFNKGVELIKDNRMFKPLFRHINIIRDDKKNLCPKEGYAVVNRNGTIYAHPTRIATPDEWFYILIHCALHLGFGHFQEKHPWELWNIACDCFISRFLKSLKIGKVPNELDSNIEFMASSEDALFRKFQNQGVSPELVGYGTAGDRHCDMIWEPLEKIFYLKNPIDWEVIFGEGISYAVEKVVQKESNIDIDDEDKCFHKLTKAQKARKWFISHYPLLGSLAAGFNLIEDSGLCGRMKISVAAINSELQEIYINPAAGLDDEQYRFVIAHELLHVGLRHETRAKGRDYFLWNVACDYIINGWLIEMRIGQMPDFGFLHDPSLKELSAESIYDIIVKDLRRFRKVATFRGYGLGDILNNEHGTWNSDKGIGLDEFYRRSLINGLEYHQTESRGYIPAGLIEEIRALSQPPIPWDVELARWFDSHFAPVEKHQTYARVSRRQSATPDIPRPRWAPIYGAMDSRTFGVILDTSGSMDRNLLAKALGTIACYSMSRDVPYVRVVFCDATYYDQGYMPPEAIADTVKVRGRGGTILQPAIHFLEKSEDFPKDGPILIITDGFCDKFNVNREHAFVVPKGNMLPFTPRGKVFYII
ncbi:MAG: peptidase [Desulfobacterales bacterium]|nr:peptidase [Desulfobacterales bacterium]